MNKKRSKQRKIAVITGSRAEYGLLYWVIRHIADNPALKLQLIVTGTHLSQRFGYTVKDIIKDGFPICAKVKLPLSSDSEKSIAESMGRAMIGFAGTYARCKPDMIVVLGDRFEIHAAVSAAIPFRIPVAHIHGGETTEGVIDEPIRHSITKMSHIHFPCAREYKKRIIQMGEGPDRVFSFGSPGIDNIVNLKLFDRKRLYRELGIDKNRKLGIVTYHPVTLEAGTARTQILRILKAIKMTDGIFWLFTLTNADTGGSNIIREIKRFVAANPGSSRLYKSLGQKRYLSLLKHAHVMVGNSSSGLIEAPTLKLPAVNIGNRQEGRIKARNVIDVKGYETVEIKKAIDKALSSEFRKGLKGSRNPYGEGKAAGKIVKRLAKIKLDDALIKKKFHNINAL